MQNLPDIEKTDSTEKMFCLKRTLFNGTRKVCENFSADTDKLDVVVYRYRTCLHLKGNEVDLKLLENQSV